MDNERLKYRAWVGPQDQYDLVSAMVFNLLTSLGLRQHHRVVDIGCGSLRVGRLLIPYLNPGNYFGVDPSDWLIKEGVKHEIGEDFLKLKKPTLIVDNTLKNYTEKIDADYMFAQSVFSHCGLNLIDRWLDDVKFHLSESGIFLATFHVESVDYDKSGWVYPGSVGYKIETIQELASKKGLHFQMINWSHPRQNWCILWKDNTDTSLFQIGPVSWNQYMEPLCLKTHKNAN